VKIVFTLLPLILLSGCIKEVQPWEKETLSSETMTGEIREDVERYEQHIYFSKEASKGGSGVGGGGCGCN
jgi:hypothetical protein